jgi:DNA-binding GntR family transcriptional regulator
MLDTNTPRLQLSKPDSLRSRIEASLREAIMNGNFKPGERLREKELCEQLDISRASLREALRKLEADKLLTSVPHKGLIVTAITPAEAHDLYAVRALLEGHAAHEFARLASDAQITELGHAVANLHTEAASGDRMRLLAAKAHFYEVILDGCGNTLIKEMLLALLSRINLLRATSFSGPQRLQHSLKEIDHLYSLIKARNAQAAQQAAQKHIINAQTAAMAVLNQDNNPLSPEGETP